MTSFFVAGVPVPQGSKDLLRSRTRDGRVITRLVESSNRKRKSKKANRLTAWREAIGWAAKAIYRVGPTTSQIRLDLDFRLPKPRTSKLARPTGKPDLSKLIRAVEDALTGIVWRDDAQITYLAASKRWAVETCGAAVAVGVHVTISVLG